MRRTVGRCAGGCGLEAVSAGLAVAVASVDAGVAAALGALGEEAVSPVVGGSASVGSPAAACAKATNRRSSMQTPSFHLALASTLERRRHKFVCGSGRTANTLAANSMQMATRAQSHGPSYGGI